MFSKFSPLFILAAFATAFADFECLDGAKPFEGTGRAATESKARESANTDIAGLFSTIKVNILDELTQKETSDDIKEYANYQRKIKIEGSLYTGYVKDAEGYPKKEGSQFVAKRYLCPSDAAKPYLDSLKAINQRVAIQKISNSFCENLYKTYSPRVMLFERILERFGETDKAQTADYKKAEKGCNEYCTAKLHWNPEKKTAYSDIAFSKLSSIGMETSDCKGKGISIVYNGSEAKCKYAGVYQCVHKPSLHISSCSGEVYKPFESGNIESYEKTEAAALEALQESLRNETFWNKWEQEIKQWRPKCD